MLVPAPAAVPVERLVGIGLVRPRRGAAGLRGLGQRLSRARCRLRLRLASKGLRLSLVEGRLRLVERLVWRLRGAPRSWPSRRSSCERGGRLLRRLLDGLLRRAACFSLPARDGSGRLPAGLALGFPGARGLAPGALAGRRCPLDGARPLAGRGLPRASGRAALFRHSRFSLRGAGRRRVAWMV